MKRLIIMQGHSGSGKSTLINDLVQGILKEKSIVLSTDNYFMEDGEYKFDESKLKRYHHQTWLECANIMRNAYQYDEEGNLYKPFDDVEWIWLDNTNCKDEDVKKYIDYADLYGYQVSFFRVDGEYESKAPSHIVKQQKEDLRKFNYFRKSEQLS